MFTCSKCGKPCANGTGKAAHERRCTGAEAVEPTHTEPESAPVLIYEAKGWQALSVIGRHIVKNNLGQVLGEFLSPSDAKRFLENTQRWIK